MFPERKIESILKTIAGTWEYGLDDSVTQYYLNDGTKTNVPQGKELNEKGTSGGQAAGQIPNREPKRQVVIPYTCDTDHLNSQFRTGSRVEVQHDGTKRGVIRWIGYVKDPQQLLAGIELVFNFNDTLF